MWSSFTHGQELLSTTHTTIGMTVADGRGEMLGCGLGEVDGPGLGDSDGSGEGDSLGSGDGLALGFGEGLTLGEGDGFPPPRIAGSLGLSETVDTTSIDFCQLPSSLRSQEHLPPKTTMYSTQQDTLPFSSFGSFCW